MGFLLGCLENFYAGVCVMWRFSAAGFAEEWGLGGSFFGFLF